MAERHRHTYMSKVRPGGPELKLRRCRDTALEGWRAKSVSPSCLPIDIQAGRWQYPVQGLARRSPPAHLGGLCLAGPSLCHEGKRWGNAGARGKTAETAEQSAPMAHAGKLRIPASMAMVAGTRKKLPWRLAQGPIRRRCNREIHVRDWAAHSQSRLRVEAPPRQSRPWISAMDSATKRGASKHMNNLESGGMDGQTRLWPTLLQPQASSARHLRTRGEEEDPEVPSAPHIGPWPTPLGRHINAALPCPWGRNVVPGRPRASTNKS